MSEQSKSRPVDNTDAFNQRLFNLVKRLKVSWELTELVAKRYPYGEKFSSNYQQDEDVAHVVSIIKQEGQYFRESKKAGKTVKNHLEKWVVPLIGDLTDDEIRIIKRYWLAKES